jgi:hypothetical protein
LKKFIGLKCEGVIAITVYYGCFPRHADTLGSAVELSVYMPVDKVTWGISFNQGTVAVKSFMAAVFRIMDSSRRGVGYNHIEPLKKPESKPQPPDLRTHFPFPVLVWISVVPP